MKGSALLGLGIWLQVLEMDRKQDCKRLAQWKTLSYEDREAGSWPRLCVTCSSDAQQIIFSSGFQCPRVREGLGTQRTLSKCQSVVFGVLFAHSHLQPPSGLQDWDVQTWQAQVTGQGSQPGLLAALPTPGLSHSVPSWALVS